MSPEKDLREGFEECFNIFVKHTNSCVECRIRYLKGLQANKLNVVCVVQNNNHLLDRRTHN